MSAIDEIKKMRLEGRSDQEIYQSLQQEGFPGNEIQEALAQTQIREAVIAPPQGPLILSDNLPAQEYQPQLQEPIIPTPFAQEYDSSYGSLQPSLMNQPEQYAETPEYQTEYPQEQQYDSQYTQYPQISSDTITEIAEQTVAEKLSKIRNELEKVIDIKITTETKLSNLNERLQRIEKIIDNLQLSIMQKVGEYTENVADLKNEVIETQKSFTTLSHKAQHHPHHTHQHEKSQTEHHHTQEHQHHEHKHPAHHEKKHKK